MDGKEPIQDAKDIQDAMDTIKAIEFFGFALEETSFKPKWFEAIKRSMDILREIHDDLVARLPSEVIAAERAKSNVPPPAERPVLRKTTEPLGVA